MATSGDDRNLALFCDFENIALGVRDAQRAIPVLMDRITFSDLFTLSGDQGGRELFARYPVQWVPWHDSAILQEVSTRRMITSGYSKHELTL